MGAEILALFKKFTVDVMKSAEEETCQAVFALCSRRAENGPELALNCVEGFTAFVGFVAKICRTIIK